MSNSIQAARWARGMVTVSGANVIVFGLSAFAALLMPLVLDVEGYAYWQLFGLYSSFAGFFVLGFNDGVYLRYSHVNIGEHVGVFKGFLKVVMLLGAVGAIALLVVAQLVSSRKSFAVMATGVCVLFYGSNGFFSYVNQMRLQLRRYATALVLEKTVFVAAVSVLFAANTGDYRVFVGVSIGAALVKLAFNVVSNWPIIAGSGTRLNVIREDVTANFRQGFLLMLAVLMCGSILVPARLLVEYVFGTKPFGIFSFALTAVSVISLCVLSVGQVFYPILRRIAPELYPLVFRIVHEMMTVISALVLCLFFVVELLVRGVYGQYSGMLTYLAYLFPTCIFQSKYILLVLNEQKLNYSMRRAFVGGATGMLLNLILSLVACFIFQRVEAVAAASLVCYILWFYPWWLDLLRRKRVIIDFWAFADLFIVGMFLLSTVFARGVFDDKSWGALVSAGIYVLFAAVVALVGWVHGRPRWAILRTAGGYSV